MAKRTVEAHKVGENQWRVCIPEALQATFGATRRFFGNEKEAEDFAAEVSGARQSYRTQFAALPEGDQGRLLLALMTVKMDSEQLVLAASAWNQKEQIQDQDILPAMEAHLKAKGCKSQKHLRQIRADLESLAGAVKSQKLDKISSEEVQGWMASRGWSETTKFGVYARLDCFFGWCIEKHWLREKPLQFDRPEPPRARIEVFSTEEISKLLRAAYQLDRPMLSYLALGFFTGTREAELHRLTPAMRVNNHFAFPADCTKDGRPRRIEISTTLAQWLEICPEYGSWENCHNRRQAICRLAGVAWKSNGMRKSFCSYSVGSLGAKGASRAMGNSPDMIRGHYDIGYVTPEEEQRFFNDLTPASVLKDLIQIAANQ